MLSLFVLLQIIRDKKSEDPVFVRRDEIKSKVSQHWVLSVAFVNTGQRSNMQIRLKLLKTFDKLSQAVEQKWEWDILEFELHSLI